MKRNNPPFPFEAPPTVDRGRRYPMNRVARTLLIILLILILAAAGLAWYASTYPLVIQLDRQTLAYNRASSINYTVNLKQDTFGDKTNLPMEQVYIRDTVDSLDLLFTYDLFPDRSVNWNSSYQIDALVQVCDQDNPDMVYLQQKINLVAPRELRDQSNLAIVDEIKIELDEYEALARQYNPDPNLPVTYRLQIRLSLNATAGLAGGSYVLADQLVMNIPLLEPSMLIERVLPPADQVLVRQPINYQLELAPLPFFIYPATGGLTLVLLILLLLVTKNRQKSRFQRLIKRRLRRVKKTLIFIGNKAWEPQWCIRITNFMSMARTAKKLKLPVFCYIEKRLPVAYFYIQLGENNYCYIFSPDPDIDLTQLDMDAESQPRSADIEEDAIPVLPDDDDWDEELVSIDNLNEPGEAAFSGTDGPEQRSSGDDEAKPDAQNDDEEAPPDRSLF